jgi:hydroxymethylpyrimidine/phosphomethylpyrimidine kinase
MRVALTIAGSDSSGGAGIQADLKTFQAHGVFGTSAITAVTVQNTQRVAAVQELEPAIVRDQILCLFDDMPIHAVKIGMVSSTGLIVAVAEALGQVARPPVVLDPVMISKSGYPLLAPEARQAMIARLFPLAEVVTPNIHEAQVLVGRPIATVGAAKVVVKGGHLGDAAATDVLYDGRDFRELSRQRIDSRHTHGTGCTFSSAVAANLALGKDFFEAVDRAKQYITEAIARAPRIGRGHGPVQHFYAFYDAAGLQVD